MPDFIKPERLAYWYFRLNGFLTIENFILHDEQGGPQRTDLDLIAVRFPRREALRKYDEREGWMEDDRRLAIKEKVFGAFVEVTRSPCKLNGPWTDREKGNLPRALRALGAIPDREIKQASERLYDVGRYDLGLFELGLVSLGKEINPELSNRMPCVLQIVWDEVANFIFDRSRNTRRLSESIHNGTKTGIACGECSKRLGVIRHALLGRYDSGDLFGPPQNR